MSTTHPASASAESFEKEQVRTFLGPSPAGIFVEVGANDPTAETSQSWHLEQIGWSGVLVEPIASLCEAARARRPRSKVINAACTRPEKVGEAELKVPIVRGDRVTAHAGLDPELDQAGYSRYDLVRVKAVTLDSVLQELAIPRIDLLSVDVEGTELDVLKGFSFHRYRPRLVLLEDKLVFLDKHRFLKQQGYRLLRRTGFNNWYVPAESGARPRPAERMKLFRKLYLSLPFRKLKESIKKRNLDPFLGPRRS